MHFLVSDYPENCPENTRLWQKINASGIPVLAVDIPSGIHAGTGQVMGTAIRATETVTFAYRKLGISLYPGSVYAGHIQVKDVGIYGASEGVFHWITKMFPGFLCGILPATKELSEKSC